MAFTPRAMPTLHLLCGLPGSGKSTLALRLEREESAIRLTTDEWMNRLGADGYDAATREAVEALQWELAQALLAKGVSVILENGFWRREERDRLRARATELGADTRLHILDVPREELLRRLAARNAALPPDTFRVRLEDLDEWMINAFEPPTAEELGADPGAGPGAESA